MRHCRPALALAALLLAATLPLTVTSESVEDSWQAHADAPEIEIDGPWANATGTIPTTWRTVYGSNVCSGTGTIEWNIYVKRPHDDNTNAWDFAVGVARDNHAAHELFVRHPGEGFAYFAQTGNKDDGINAIYGDTYDDGDVITVKLDLDAGMVEYMKNNVSQGIAYSSFDTKGDWRVAVGFSSKGYGAHLSGGIMPDSCTPAPEPEAVTSGSSKSSGDGDDGEIDVANAPSAVTTEGSGFTPAVIAGTVVGALALALILIGTAYYISRRTAKGRTTVTPADFHEDVEAGRVPPVTPLPDSAEGPGTRRWSNASTGRKYSADATKQQSPAQEAAAEHSQ